MLTAHNIWQLVKMARPLNLVIAGLTFILAAYIGWNNSFGFLRFYEFYAELTAIVLIMAAGYWINDVFDFRVDRVNRPQTVIVNKYISTKKVVTAYMVVNSLITIGSLLLPIRFLVVNLAAMLALLLYARFLKRWSVFGNLTIASLCALTVLVGGMIPEKIFFKLPLIWPMVFAFWLTLLREIAKDIEDIKGDVQFGMMTLPVQIGIKSTRRLLEIGLFATLVLCYMPAVFEFIRTRHVHYPYLLASIILVQMPLAYILLLLSRTQKPNDYHQVSRWLKYTILGGLISILFLLEHY